ncbi:MAG: ABC transporter ATP-binding protein [Myxococcales bacterium]|nr:ABC transporter ATP-binding protein [Myxococcales bacterium]
MTAAGVPALEARGLVRDLGDEVKTRILHGIDLAIAPGEFVSVTGASGSGKSTLLYLLGALDRPTEGEVLIEGQPTAGLDDRARGALRAERLGFVFQFHFLLPEFTSVENVAIPMLRRKDIAPAEARRRAAAALTSLGIGELADRRPTQLSGGQQQRVSIARAIAHRPRILLADEPTGNLDTAAGAAVLEIFERLAQGGMTIVMVTHEPSYAARAQREIRLRDGRIVDVVARAAAPAATPAG